MKKEGGPNFKKPGGGMHQQSIGGGNGDGKRISVTPIVFSDQGDKRMQEKKTGSGKRDIFDRLLRSPKR